MADENLENPGKDLVGFRREADPPSGPPVAAVPGGRPGTLAAASSEQAPTTRYDLRVLQALRRIIRAVDLHSRKLLAQHRITGPQLVCLLAVEENQPVTGSAIARHVHLSPSTVIGILDRLEAFMP